MRVRVEGVGDRVQISSRSKIVVEGSVRFGVDDTMDMSEWTIRGTRAQIENYK